jgi:sortase A
MLRQVERFFLALGLLFVAVFLAAYVDRKVAYRAELDRFRELQRENQARNLSSSKQQAFDTDFGLWSDQRIAAYKDTLTQQAGAPLAVLRVATVKLEVPVLEGTSEFVLNRAVGHIPGTEIPGRFGNIGIAGHRDGFFRVLKDVGVGDTIELETSDRTDSYRVDQVAIVSPDDTSVLKQRAAPSLTLVTCYPFYFVGSAPKRYIVEASLFNPTHSQRSLKSRSRTPPVVNPYSEATVLRSQKSNKEITQ